MLYLPHIPSIVVYIVIFIDFFIAFFFLSVFVSTKIKKEEKEFRPFELTFVLPAYNVGKILEKTLDSIKKAKYPQEKIKIIIVNDGSTDNTLEVAKKLSQNNTNIQVFSKKNTGKADSLNYGIKQAKTELIATLDSDSLIMPDLLEKAVTPFSDKSIMAVTSRLKPLNREKLIEKMQYVEYTLAGFYRRLMGHINSLPAAPAFTIYRRDFFLKHGYFDTDNLTEDFEISLRIQSHQYNISYVADSYALTDVPNNLYKLYRQRLRWNYGTFYNYRKYKHIFFNKDYGDLGFFVLPAGFLSILMVSLTMLMASYTIMVWIIENIQKLLIGWRPSFEFNLERFALSVTDLRILLFLFTLLLALTIFFLIRSELKEKIGIRDFFVTMSIFLWTLALFYIIGFIYFIRNKKPTWS